jgi:hypothetical protein
VSIGREGAAEREAVGSGLLLPVAPCGRSEVVQERGPLDSCFDLDDAGPLVEAENAPEPASVEEDAVAAELLAAHRVPSAGDGHGKAAGAGRSHSLGEGLERFHADHLANGGLVQLRVDVVDDGHLIHPPVLDRLTPTRSKEGPPVLLLGVERTDYLVSFGEASGGTKRLNRRLKSPTAQTLAIAPGGRQVRVRLAPLTVGSPAASRP